MALGDDDTEIEKPLLFWNGTWETKDVRRWFSEWDTYEGDEGKCKLGWEEEVVIKGKGKLEKMYLLTYSLHRRQLEVRPVESNWSKK